MVECRVLDLTDAISRIQLLHSDDVKSFFLQRSHKSPGLKLVRNTIVTDQMAPAFHRFGFCSKLMDYSIVNFACPVNVLVTLIWTLKLSG